MSSTPPAPALLHRLVDDAAAFPPASLPLAEALDRHREHRSAWYGDVVGPLLVPAAAAGELVGLLGQAAAGDGAPLEVVVVGAATADDPLGAALAAVDALADDPRAAVVGLEAPVPDLGAAVEALAGIDVDAWLERPAGTDDLAALGGAGGGVGGGAVRGLKLRTGGTAPVPPSAAVAASLRAAVAAGVPVKLTAGLHRAVPSAPASGGEHGFLGVLVAVRALVGGAPQEHAAAALESTDADRLVRHLRGLGDDEARAVRGVLRSFGCCGVTDPVDDLLELGLLERGA